MSGRFAGIGPVHAAWYIDRVEGARAKFMSRIAGTALVAIVVATGETAAANPLLCNTEIDWQAPDECPTEDEFAAQLAALVGAPPPGPVHIAVRVRPTEAGFALYLRIQSTTAGGGTAIKDRKLEDPSCEVVAESAATVVATSIDPLDGPTELALGHCPQIDDGDIPSLLRPASGDGEDGPDYPLRGAAVLGLPLDLAIRVMLGGDSGTINNFGSLDPSLNGVAAVQRGRWRFELGVSHLFEHVLRWEEDPDKGTAVALSSLGVRACAELYRGWLLGSLCAGGELGRFDLRTVGLSESEEETARYLAAGGAVSIARVLLKNIYLRIDAGTWVPLVRPRFGFCAVSIANEGCFVPVQLGQPASAVTRVFAGLELVFR